MQISRFRLALLAALFSAAVAEAADDAVELDPVVVQGEADERLSYAVEDAGSATKTDTPLVETPASVSVITEEMMRDRGAHSLQDALRYSAGVMSDAYGLDNRTDSAIIRGTEFQQVLDGMREQFNYYNTTRPDPYSLERVEVLKSPASVLYGQGPVSGVVALVSKRPQEQAAREVQLEYGSFERRRVAADFTGPVTAGSELLYRVVGVYQASDSQVDYAHYDREMLQPSLTWRPTDAVEWTLLAAWQRDDSANTISFLPHSGTVLPNPNGQIPVQRFTSEPGFDRFEAERYALTSQLRLELSPVWSLHQNLRFADHDNPYYTMYPDVFTDPQNPFLDEAQRTVARIVYVELRRQRDVTADHQAQARFATGALQHHLLLGIDAATSRYESEAGYGYNAEPFDLYAPVYGLPFEVPEFGPEAVSHSRFTGAYVQDQVKAGPWVGVAGLRYDRATTTPAGGQDFSDHDVTGRIGLLYHAANGLAPYLSYAESFLQNPYLDENGAPYEPLRGQQIEAGIKYQPAGGATLLTAAVFDISEENRLFYGLVGTTGLADVDASGVELEAATRLGAFDLTASYTYTDTEKREYTSVPPHNMASFWAKYGWQGFELGAGLRYLGKTTDESGALELPSVTLIDAMAAYQYQHWRFALNATNVEDETYVTSCLMRGDCFYGNRGAVVGTVSYRY